MPGKGKRGSNGGASAQQQKFYCEIHKENPTHATKDCKQKQQSNNKSTDSGQKDKKCKKCGKLGHDAANCRSTIKCTKCGRSGHSATDCRTNDYSDNNKNKKDKKQTPPRKYSNMDWTPGPEYYYQKGYDSKADEAGKNYCIHCNVLGHSPANCTNFLAFHKTFQSKLCCDRCGSRGHLISDCNNPVSDSQRCLRCLRDGRNRPDCIMCKIQPNPEVEARIRAEGLETGGHGRFTWRADYLNHESQKAQYAYHEAQRVAKENGTELSADEHAFHREQIFKSSQIFGTDPLVEAASAAGYNIHTDTKPNTSTSAPKTTSTPKPTPTSTSTSIPKPLLMLPAPKTNVRTRSQSIALASEEAQQKKLLSKMRSEGFSADYIKYMEAVFLEARQKSKTDLDKRIEAKINSTLCYTFRKANDKIRLDEPEILCKQILTQAKMDSVKYAILTGANFFRDPRVFKALFSRQIPRCNTCGINGMIFDRWFCAAGLTKTKLELLALQDFRDWGLFVGFQCGCASVRVLGEEDRINFSYVDCCEEDLEGLKEEDR